MTTNNNTTLKYAIEKKLLPLVEWILTKSEKPTNLEECLALAIENKVDDKIIELLVNALTKSGIPEPIKIEPIKTYPELIDFGMFSCKDNSHFVYDLAFNRNTVWNNFQYEKYSENELIYKNAKNATALHYLAYFGEEINGGLEMFMTLMNKIDVNDVAGSMLVTPLMIAVAKGGYVKPNLKIIELLLNHPKIELNIKNTNRMTAFKRVLTYCPSKESPLKENWTSCFKLFQKHPQIKLFEIDEDSKYSYFEYMFGIEYIKPIATEFVKRKAIAFNLKTDLVRIENSNLCKRALCDMIKAYMEHYPECLLA